MKRILIAFSVLLIFYLQAQAQGTHISLDGAAYLSGTTPNTSPWDYTGDAVWVDARVSNLRTGFAADQVLWDFGGFGVLYVRAVAGGVTNLEFVPARLGGGTCAVNITGRSDLMVRVQFARNYGKYFMQVWDARGQSYVQDVEPTTDVSPLPMRAKTYSVGAKTDGTLKVQTKLDFLRLFTPIGAGHAPIAGSPFPEYVGYFDYNDDWFRFEFENNLTNQGSQATTLSANGTVSYATNANTPPVAVGEDRTGQSKGALLLNGTASYDYERGLSNSASWACVSAPAPLTCANLTFRDSGATKLATWVDGATQAGTYVFSLQVSDGSLSGTDSSVSVSVAAVSASISNASCYAGEACLIDASASTGYRSVEGLTVNLGDGFSMNIPKGAHAFMNAGTYTLTATARAADGATHTATATATVVERPAADTANTIDMRSSADGAYYVSPANCTGDPAGNMAKLQAAVNTAKGRNTAPQKIVVRAHDDAGNRCVYQGQLFTRAPAGSAQILLVSSAANALPPRASRVALTDLPNMPLLRTVTSNSPVMTPQPGEVPKGYKFEGFEFQSTATQQDVGIVQLGDPAEIDSEADMPDGFVISHCVIRPPVEASYNVKNAITTNAHRVTVLDSRLGPNSYHGAESHGVGATYGTVHSYVNNFNGGASIPVLIGGATSRIEGATSSDMEFRRNYHYRDPAWFSETTRWRAVKNLFELKNAVRVVVQGNRMENNWPDGQSGHAILVQCVYDSGDWCKVEDVDFSDNFILNAARILSINGREYNETLNIRRLLFRGNLWQNIDPTLYSTSTSPDIGLYSGPLEVSFIHNTFRQPNSGRLGSLSADADGDNLGEARLAGLVWRDNIADGWGCGFFGDSYACGPSGINVYAHASEWKNSVQVADHSGLYPTWASGMMYPPTEAHVEFTDAGDDDWSLAPGSDYKGQASDGTDPGVHWATFKNATEHTTDGSWASLPSPWQSQDVGAVGVAGSASYSGGVFTVKGSGADIWGGADSFRYVYQPLSGDGQIVARVTGLQHTSGSAQVGVMIRQALTEDSPHVQLGVNPVIGGIAPFLLARPRTGANTAWVGGAGSDPLPFWLKLVRSGSTFKGYTSTDGVNWTLIASTNVTMSMNVYVGFVVCSANNSVLNTTTFDNVTVSASLPSACTPPTTLIISEFRLRGPAGSKDEFVEFYNKSASAITVCTADQSWGWALSARKADGTSAYTAFVIPHGTVIPARGHLLAANNSSGGYSLSNYPAGNGTTATPDLPYTDDIEDNVGIALFKTANPAAFTSANRLDAVGSTAEADTLYREGTGYAPVSTGTANYSFFRDLCILVSGCTATDGPKDTGSNAADFFYVDTDGTSAGAGQRLGAPGPENLSSPVRRDSIAMNLLDSSVSAASAPNRVRDLTSDPSNNSTFGTLSIRRRAVNNTGAAVTRLRFRVIEVTTFPPPAGTADLRPLSSVAVTTTVNDAGTCLASTGSATTPCTVTVQGTTLETPPAQPNGGGYNSTLSAGTITLAAPLANGASINVQFLLGVQQTGTFRFYIEVEALP